MITGNSSSRVGEREMFSASITAMIARPENMLLVAAHSHSAISTSSSSTGALRIDAQVCWTCMREYAEYRASKLAAIAVLMHTEPAARKTM